MKKNNNFRMISLLLAFITLISVVSVSIVNATTEYPSEEWFAEHFVEINQIGYFNTSTVTLYQNPTESPEEKIELSMESLPETFVVQYKFTEDDSTEWYLINTEDWSEYSEYGYVSVDAVTLKQSTAPVDVVDFTNAAPIIENFSTAALYSNMARFSSRAISSPIVPNLVEASAPSGLVMNKTAAAAGDDYKITLEAYTTGTITVEHTTKPMDIVLVIDQSGSMENDLNSYTYTAVYTLDDNSNYYVKDGSQFIEVTYCDNCQGWTNGCSWWLGHRAGEKYSYMTSENDIDSSHVQFYSRSKSTQKRLDALVSVLNNFVANVEAKTSGSDEQKGTADDVDHRIAVVGFSSDNFNNTELLTGVAITEADPIDDGNTSYYPKNKAYNGVQYSSITTTQYQNALQDVSTTAGQTSVTNAINALTAHGGTETLDGLDMAYKILENDTKKEEERNKVVILFTDGATDSTRSQVVNKAYDIKNDYNATVYSVGIFDGANGEISSHTNSIDNNNTLMHAISSNYPDAQVKNRQYVSGSVNPNLKSDESYYLSASDTTALNSIFQSISNQIGAETLDLGSSTVVKDIVSPYFNLPENASDVLVQSFGCLSYSDSTGKATWSTTGTTLENAVTIDTENNSVNVSGFDFKANYVSEKGRLETDDTQEGDFHGRKLVITFTISVKDGFWGGNNVPTNGENSGIYENEAETEATGTFRVPTINIPIKEPTLTGVDKNIYLYGEVPQLNDLYTTNIPTSEADAWKIAYVNIDGPMFTNTEQTISNTEDTENIGITVAVSPKYDGTNADCGEVNLADGKTAAASANVYVFKPVLTFQDSVAYYGGDVPSYTTDNLVSTVWKHGETVADVSAMGEPPELSLSYSVPDDAIKDGKVNTKTDIPVNATAKIGEQDIMGYVTLQHQACASNCGFDADNEEFLLHVKTCSLAIEKTGGKTGEPYVFYISKDGVKYTELTITGNDRVTLCELPVGTYTVQEDTQWSWRFKDTSFDKNSVTLSESTPEDTVTCTNSSYTDQWLNGLSTVIKNIFGETKTN